MLSTALHAIAWNCPELRLKIDLRPTRADDLAGSCGGQNQEFQRPRRDPVTRGQFRHEGRNVSEGQGSVMLHLRDGAAGRQRFGQMTTPPGRIVAAAKTVDGTPPEHLLDP